MNTIDTYIVSVVIYSLCVILLKCGAICYKWKSIKRNERIFDILLLIPYFTAVLSGLFLIITKEVTL